MLSYTLRCSKAEIIRHFISGGIAALEQRHGPLPQWKDGDRLAVRRLMQGPAPEAPARTYTMESPQPAAAAAARAYGQAMGGG